MPTLDMKETQIVLNEIQSDVAGFTHDSQQVTVTATMKNGSLLKADGTEAGKTEGGSVVGVINDMKARSTNPDWKAASVIHVAVAKRGCVFNEEQCAYTKTGATGAIDAAAKAELAKNLNTFA